MTFGTTVVHQLIVDDAPGATKLTYVRPEGTPFATDVTSAITGVLRRTVSCCLRAAGRAGAANSDGLPQPTACLQARPLMVACNDFVRPAHSGGCLGHFAPSGIGPIAKQTKDP